MRRYGIFFIILCAFSLCTFLVVERFDINLLKDPSNILHKGGALAAIVGTLLLIFDVILPVPASLIMVANGAIFGLWMGSALSMLGGILSSYAGHYLGKAGSRKVKYLFSKEEQEQSNRLLRRWGMLAVLVSRPIPIIAESISIMAGMMLMPEKKFLFAAWLGIMPASVLLAYTGVYALNIESGLLSFGLVMLIAGIFWAIGIYTQKGK